MIDTIVFVSVKPECVDAFIEATLENHRNSRKEPANIRFDVLRDDSDPTKFILCEVYADAAGAAAHKETAHYAKWRDTVAPMMAEPRRSIKTTPLAFD
ncbi:MAG: antibiotic biosynthesis monooxygenase [Clostridia bacterium]|nr:antibiotic biosynthesis monooxygenase [Clostridia bacterium]